MSLLGEPRIRLSVRGVSKAFTTGKRVAPVIREITMDVLDQEFVAVIGPSGTGKTTLLNIMAGIVPPDAGEVLTDGLPVRGPGPERGMVFQQYAVFPWLTVRDNIGFGLGLRAARGRHGDHRAVVQHYVNLMGLQGFENAWPKTLSGGMKQRVAIARAYAAKPEILLMDEPFGALDAQTRDQMQDVLQEAMAREKTAAVFVTHSVEEAIFLSHRVVVLGGRPATIRDVVRVQWEFPRNREVKLTPEFLELRRHIESLLRDDVDSTRPTATA